MARNNTLNNVHVAATELRIKGVDRYGRSGAQDTITKRNIFQLILDTDFMTFVLQNARLFTDVA